MGNSLTRWYRTKIQDNMLVKLYLWHDERKFHEVVQRMNEERYKRLKKKVNTKDGKVELLRIEILEK